MADSDPIYGFIRDQSGHTVSIKDKSGDVFVVSINTAGDVCGDKNGHGFVRTAGGVLTNFHAPGSQGTGASMLNGYGVVVGSFKYHNSLAHGFIRMPDGTITVLDFPGGHQTIAQVINAGGTVAGTYLDANEVMHGFVRDSSGIFTSFDPPAFLGYMYATGINLNGFIIGNYQSDSVVHGFVRKPGGKVRTLDAPKAYNLSILYDINNNNVTVGEFADSITFTDRAFIRTP